MLTIVLVGLTPSCWSCTSLLVTKGASADGSVMITYTCDGVFHPTLESSPAGDFPPGDSLPITDWHDNVRGWIKQVEHTYAVVGLMNEHQLAISETTFDGHKELRNTQGLLHYWDLMQLALQRSRTAREAITVMTDLVARYGYGSTGETFSLADTEEAWIMEMIGPGEGGTGAAWVALRVPDGYISCHANKARIGRFPLDDPANCVYSENVMSLAIEKGYYDPDSGNPFLFNEAYCPSTPKNQRWGDTRVWSIFRRAAPSMNLSPDFHRAVPDAEPYPLWIKPDARVSLAGVFELMRDHYEGTAFDMTRGVDAGPYGSPYRWRPLDFAVDSVEYAWERQISTQQTGFSFVSQSRGNLPDPIGGVYWYGVDDTYTTVWCPLYCSINRLPESFTQGDIRSFSWGSAWWVFNFVANYANLKYSFMISDIQAVQANLEGEALRLQATVDRAALDLYESDRAGMVRYLTDYSVSHAERVVARWRRLGEELMVKYNDGYVRSAEKGAEMKGYPDAWLKEIVTSRPDQFLLPVADTIRPEPRLVD